MGTRSRVGILNEDETITSIYIHWDGYPSHMLVKLKENLKTDRDVQNFIDEGDRSTFEESYKAMRNEKTQAETHSRGFWPNTDQEYQYTWANGKWSYDSKY